MATLRDESAAVCQHRIAERARALENDNRLGIDGITVVGIDFTDPRHRR